MKAINGRQLSSAGLAVALLSALAWGAPPQEESQAAPVPKSIISARTAFISNAGGGCSSIGQDLFSGAPDRAYNRFYAAMKSWGRYTVADAPAGAELDFEISYACPVGETAHGETRYIAALKVVIMDVKTHVVLWEITELIRFAALESNRNKNFDQAMTTLVGKLKLLAGMTPPAPASGGTSQ